MNDTVTVASKLPMDLVLHQEEVYQTTEPGAGGVLVAVKRHRRLENTVVIRGASRHVGEPNDSPLRDGFSLTHGVDKAFWEQWLAGHRDYQPIVSGMLFAVEKPADAKAETRNREHEKSGFEPADPDDLPQEFKAAGGRNKISKAR